MAIALTNDGTRSVSHIEQHKRYRHIFATSLYIFIYSK